MACCWSANYEAELGVYSMVEYESCPTAVVASSNVTGSSWSAIIVGDSNLTCGIRNDSTVYCWGYNAEGRLGDPNYSAYLRVSPRSY